MHVLVKVASSSEPGAPTSCAEAVPAATATNRRTPARRAETAGWLRRLMPSLSQREGHRALSSKVLQMSRL